MSAPLVLAVPSKGRLQEDTQKAFSERGLDLVRSGAARRYRGRIAGIAGAEVAYLSAPEIAREVGAGAVHLGVTGRDQVEETIRRLAGQGRPRRAARLRPLRRGGRRA